MCCLPPLVFSSHDFPILLNLVNLSVFFCCFTSFSISWENRVKLNGIYFYPLSFPLNSCHYFTNWGQPIVGNVMTSTKGQNMLRFSSANLKIHKLTVNVFTSVFPAYAFLWVCVYIKKLHMGNVCMPVVVPLRLLPLLFYISWLVTVVMHWLCSEQPPPSSLPTLTP